MNSNNRYFIITSLPLKRNNECICKGTNRDYNYVYTAEPQIMELMLEYPVSQIIAIGTRESVTASVENQNSETNQSKAGNIDNIFKIEIDKCRFIYYDLFHRIAEDKEVSEKYNGINVPVKLVVSEESNINNYWADLYKTINEDAEGVNIKLLIDIQGGGRTERFVQNSLMSVISSDGKIGIEKVISSFSKEHNKNYVIKDETSQYLNIWKLVAAVNTFNRYGRTDLLADYFKARVNSLENALLDSMVDFDHAIALSDSEQIIESAKRMALCFKACKNSDAESTPLFSTLLSCMENNYGDVLYSSDKTRILYIIRWCVKMDFVQQALTLYESQTTELHTELFEETYDSEDASLQKDWSQYINNPYAKKEKAINDAIEYFIQHKEIPFYDWNDLGKMVNTINMSKSDITFLSTIAFKNVFILFCNNHYELDLSNTELDEDNAYYRSVDSALSALKNKYSKKLSVRGHNDDQAKLTLGKAIRYGSGKNDLFMKRTKTISDKIMKAINLSVMDSSDKRTSMIYYLVVKIIRNTANHGKNINSLSDDTYAAAKYLGYKMNISVPSSYTEIKKFLNDSIDFLADISKVKLKTE